MIDAVERYQKEADLIRNACLLAAERHYVAETPWYYSVYWLGFPSTILSSIAGATAFAKIESNGNIVGAISIFVAILSSATSFLKPAEKATLHHSIAKSYEKLYNECGQFCRIDLLEPEIDVAKCLEDLKQLSKRLNELNFSSPSLPGYTYKIAARNLAAGKGEVVRDDDDAAKFPPAPEQL